MTRGLKRVELLDRHALDRAARQIKHKKGAHRYPLQRPRIDNACLAGAMFPGAMAIGFHYVDYVVHSWDVARTLGHSFELPVDVVAAALPLALVVPDGDFRTIDSAPFGPAIPSTEPADDLDRILAYLGRSPHWQPTSWQAPVAASTRPS